MYKKVEGRVSHQNPNGEQKVLISALAVNERAWKLISEMKEWATAKADSDGITPEHAKNLRAGILRRSELKEAHGVLRNAKASPYFIAKNVACQSTKHPGSYELGLLRLAASAVKAAKKAAELPAAEPVTKSPAKKKVAAKKESKPKKETKAKKGETKIEAGAVVVATEPPAELV